MAKGILLGFAAVLVASILIILAMYLSILFSYSCMKPLISSSPLVVQQLEQNLNPEKVSLLFSTIESAINQQIALGLTLIVLSGWIASKPSPNGRAQGVVRWLLALAFIMIVSSLYLGLDVKYILLLSAPKYLSGINIPEEQSMLAIYSKVYAGGWLLLFALVGVLASLMLVWNRASTLPQNSN